MAGTNYYVPATVLTDLADTLRANAGWDSSVKLSWPSGFISAVSAASAIGSFDLNAFVRRTISEAIVNDEIMIAGYAFYSCTKLRTVSFHKCTSINAYAFAFCTSLATVNFPKCTTIYGAAFNSCYKLLSLYLLGSSIVTLSHVNAFNSTPISTYTTSTNGVNGSIYVPSSLLASYKAATNWVNYSSRFVGLTDEQINEL